MKRNIKPQHLKLQLHQHLKLKIEATPKVTTFSASATKIIAATPKTSWIKPQVNSSLICTLVKNNLKAPEFEEDYTSYFPKYAYRNGVGRPEGIVVHDTANDRSTINGEISYMKNNYQNAFVHAFVDGDRNGNSTNGLLLLGCGSG